MLFVVSARVDIRTGPDEQLGSLGSVRKEARPVGDDMQWRAAPTWTPEAGGRESGVLVDESLQRVEVAATGLQQ